MLRKLWPIDWRQYFRNLAIGIDCSKQTNFSRVRCAFGNVLQSSFTDMNFFHQSPKLSLSNICTYTLRTPSPPMHLRFIFLIVLPLYIHCFFFISFHLLLSNVYLSFLFIYLYQLLHGYKGHLHWHTGEWGSLSAHK